MIWGELFSLFEPQDVGIRGSSLSLLWTLKIRQCRAPHSTGQTRNAQQTRVCGSCVSPFMVQDRRTTGPTEIPTAQAHPVWVSHTPLHLFLRFPQPCPHSTRRGLRGLGEAPEPSTVLGCQWLFVPQTMRQPARSCTWSWARPLQGALWLVGLRGRRPR